ncbi:ArsR/SmtB family transcription factor [Georgenia alba]|uniref:ArsR/SmtB family transcription factor n=1 Tax=Georgenia alba TaxID=2233858 RepID=A0ABW2Q6J5_9MICO
MGRDYSVVGRAMAAPARAAMLDALMDGSSRPAGELAGAAGIGASTASEHLGVLVDAGLVEARTRGRHRFYRLRDASVATALEHLGGLCPDLPTRVHRRSREAAELAEARLCYDHLAGRLGVALTAGMRRRGWLTDELTLTDRGAEGLDGQGIDVLALRGRRRPLTRTCLDWTERQDHLAGAVGAAVAALFLDRGWVRRRRSGRGLVITPGGLAALRETWRTEVADRPASAPARA